MTFSDFTLSDALKTFRLSLNEDTELFTPTSDREPSRLLVETLEINAPLAFALNTEKARSGFMVAPILAEIYRARQGKIKIFSGGMFNVDSSSGLAGSFDFLLTHSPSQLVIESPVLSIVEARQENVPGGYGQCVATMLAEQRFNRKNNAPIETVYGAVTTGDVWKFLSLKGTDVHIDRETYYLDRIERLLGVLWRATE